MTWVTRTAVALLGAALVTAATLAGAAASPVSSARLAGSSVQAARPGPGRLTGPVVTAAVPLSRYVRVSVATLWVRPGLNRLVDAPAVAYPANPARWVASMTVAQKRWLSGRLETQALYGERVLVWQTSGAWSRVTVPSQPTTRTSSGYPGWLPTVQLTSTSPARTRTGALVTAPTAYVWNSAASLGKPTGRIMQISYGTSLPVLGNSARHLRVQLLDGRQGFLRPSDALWYLIGGRRTPTRAQAITEARRFLGLQYLWAGTSGFGYDCSGLTYAVFGRIGVRLARDASDQMRHGTVVSSRYLAPGDLVFFRSSPRGPITHVAMYYGMVRGVRSILEAPRTGLGVRVVRLTIHPYYAGARRYLSR